MDTVQALIEAYEFERRLFNRIREMGMYHEETKKIISFWIWLDTQGFKGISKKISCQDDKILSLLKLEAETALSSLESDDDNRDIDLPVTIGLSGVDSSLSLEKVFEERERVRDGISQVLEGVCGMIFKDMVGEEKGKMGIEENMENSSESRVSGSRLNPFAEEWRPKSEEERCLYMTFSKGYPLSENQIYWFFTGKYGACLEKIYVHQPKDMPPQFGKIVFKASFLPALILDGKEEVKFKINGRSLWCKKFKPKKIDIN